jgi:hydrogenase maturation protease
MERAVALRVLVAALGSTLRGDDGFGPALLRRVTDCLPAGAEGADFGTHGIALVQRLYRGYDALVLLDACARGRPPGTLYVLRPVVPEAPPPNDVASLDALADAHVSDVSRILLIARALQVLPRDVWLVGCEPEHTADHHLSLSHSVAQSLPRAVEETLVLLRAIQGNDAEQRLLG